MNDFYEVILSLSVRHGLGKAYKTAIETENSTQWKQNPIYDSQRQLISNELKPVWNGNHAYVEVDQQGDTDVLEISLVSHTLPNLQETANWYVRMGCEIQYTKY